MSDKNKNKEVTVVRSGDSALGISGVTVCAFQTVGSSTFASPAMLPFYTHTRALLPTIIGDFKIVPYGEQNNYPEELRIILDEDNFLPQGLKKDFGLIWGQGPALYKINFEAGKRIKQFVEDATIQSWLDSWDYEEYLRKSTIEYTTVNGIFTKFFRNRAPRIGGAPQIARLEHSMSLFSRLEWPDENWKVNNIIVGDFRQPWRYGLRSYPVFDSSNPFANPVSMRYSNLYNFALDYEYSRAPFHGASNWIKLASSIPKLLSNFNANSAAIKYHIKAPQIFWESKRAQLIEQCNTKGIEYTDKMLEDFKDESFKKITTALSGVDKVGKLVSTDKIFDDTANEYVDWTIDVLDQKVKDFIDAQLNIAREASFQVAAGIGLPPSLSNLSKDGNLPSGSEKLYDFKLFLMTSIDVPESIIMKAINMAIRCNFPNSNLKLGFYHDIVLTEEATNPKDRLRNQGAGNSPDPSLQKPTK